MNKTSPLKVTILDKEYLITCEEEEVDSLHNAIDYLNNKMAETDGEGGGLNSAVFLFQQKLPSLDCRWNPFI